AHQANVWLAICDTPHFHEKEMDVIRKYNRLIKANPDPFFMTKSMARIALLWPQEAGNYYSGSSVPLTDFTKEISATKAGNISEEFYGFYDGLSRGHVPFDVIDEPAISNAQGKYDLIIFPNAVCLKKEAADKIREFVMAGGNIISTFETSLYNEYGKKLGQFQLNDVFGTESTGDIFGPLRWDYLSLAETDHFSLRGIRQKNLYAPVYGLKIKSKAKVPVFFCKPLPGSYAGSPEVSEFPAIIENSFGKGKSIYIAGTFGGTLYKFHFPEYYTILTNLVSHLSKTIVSVGNTPSSMELNLRRNENSIFLYLINFTSEMRRPIQKIIPCTDLKVDIYLTKAAKSAKALCLGRDLQLIRKNNTYSVVLPVIEDFEIIEFRI
ncbi:MAG: beta-galactosidase trimerization domain-containing protein, partial [Bacteroidales bacterium]|nr:beta-galactosidase trimerization domain-containing protein [Bacteroidales bacterium]